MTERPIKVGLDYDGVVIRTAHPLNVVQRATKLWLPNSPSLEEGLNVLYEAPDVDVLGIYTIRPRMLRGFQTREQIRRRETPITRIVHTANSTVKKIEELCKDALGDSEQNADSIRQIVLIDDSAKRVVRAAQHHARRRSPTAPLLEKFTLVAFNQPETVRDLSIPEVINVIPMQDWTQMEKVLVEIQALAA